MSNVRMIIQGTVNDYEDFSSFAKHMCEVVEGDEPDTIAYEWFADQATGRAAIHEIYRTPDAFLQHFQGATDRGDLDTFLSVLDIDQVTVLSRVEDDRVRAITEQFQATHLHGLAGIVR